MTEERQVEEILIESHSYGLGNEVMETAKKFQEQGYDRVTSYELAFKEWIK